MIDEVFVPNPGEWRESTSYHLSERNQKLIVILGKERMEAKGTGVLARSH